MSVHILVYYPFSTVYSSQERVSSGRIAMWHWSGKDTLDRKGVLGRVRRAGASQWHCGLQNSQQETSRHSGEGQGKAQIFFDISALDPSLSFLLFFLMCFSSIFSWLSARLKSLVSYLSFSCSKSRCFLNLPGLFPLMFNPCFAALCCGHRAATLRDWSSRESGLRIDRPLQGLAGFRLPRYGY